MYTVEQLQDELQRSAAELDTKSSALDVMLLEHEKMRLAHLCSNRELIALRRQVAQVTTELASVKAVREEKWVGQLLRMTSELWAMVRYDENEVFPSASVPDFYREIVSRVGSLTVAIASATDCFDSLWRALNEDADPSREPEWHGALELVDLARHTFARLRRERDEACEHMFDETRRGAARIEALQDAVDREREQVQKLSGAITGSSTPGLEALEVLWCEYAHDRGAWSHPSEVVEVVMSTLERHRDRLDRLGHERLDLMGTLTRIHRAATLDPAARWVNTGEVVEALEVALSSERARSGRERAFHERAATRLSNSSAALTDALSTWQGLDDETRGRTSSLGEVLRSAVREV